MTAMTALVSGGVFERHPQFRVAFVEAVAGWASLNAQHTTV
jgi:uncharacterized protein